MLKDILGVSDRYLPSLAAVIGAYRDVDQGIGEHALRTTTRLVVGFCSGAFGGILLGVFLFRYGLLRALLMPSIHSLRAVPAAATVPFFLLWFGFSEGGRFLLVFLGTALNVAIASAQILQDIPEKYIIMLRSFDTRPERLIATFLLPSVVERILPTLRYGLVTALGLVVVSELLGSQVGLGYLIQSAKSTFALHVVFLAAIALGIVNVCLDLLLKLVWRRLVFWRQ